MYTQILLATDGSDIAATATAQAIDLAKALGAKMTAVTVSEPYEAVGFTDSMGMVDPAEYKRRTAEYAREILAGVTETAKKAGIACDTIHQDSHWPYDGIIKAAEKCGADLIVMGSHGRRGLEGLLLGSQAMKLLTHTKIATLIIR